ncbi:rhodanese-like domain-containing protein [Mesoterricola silvestris]|uniref:Rhodanese n=1 Tax=Mesoterricola silvestris TaxID=2927979 RepID=A0AA48GM59_9BACT|nr:rhodanese-like domain-containing protein [Mesoterricola silvestris]BDU73962.1 rhodanese [Mesoterricola silvestris]
MFDSHALLQAFTPAVLAGPGGFAGWVSRPEVAYPLAGGLVALLAILILKWPDFKSWRRARHKEVFRPIELEQVLHGDPPVVVDLRRPEDFNGSSGHIRGAFNLPFNHLPKALAEIAKDKRQLVVLVDYDDRVSHLAADVLASCGYTWVRVLRGGMRAWRAGNLPVSVSGHR